MPLTPEQITNAVDYFTQKNTARLSAVQSAALRPAAGSSGGGTRRTTSVGAPANRQVAGGTTAGGADLPDIIKNVVKAIPIVGSWLTVDGGGSSAPGASIVDDALAPMPENQAPQNATQWILNALGTGLYATSRFAEEAGRQAATNQWAQKVQQGDILGAAGDLGSAAVTPFGGAARGVAEGLGYRFDNERPRTQGQNLESIGAMDAVRQGVAALGGDEATQNNAVGVVGTAADIVGDPLSFIPATGISKFIRGGAEGVVDAVRAGDPLITALGRGNEAGFAARQAAKDAQAAAAAARAEQKAARSADGGQSFQQAAAEEAAQRAAAREADAAWQASRVEPQAKLTDAARAAVKSDVADFLARTDGPDMLTAAKVLGGPDPRASTINDLLPSLRGNAADIPTRQILADASVPTGAPKVTPEVAQVVENTMTTTKTIPEVRDAIKILKSTPEGKALLAEKITVEGGGQLPLSTAIEQVAMRRITGAGGAAYGTKHAALLSAVREALRVGTRVPARTTPESLTAAVTKNVPSSNVPEDLFARVAAAKTQGEREQIIRDALSLPVTFDNFDDAIAAAIDGRVEAAAMRSMLKALGVDTKATKTSTLREALAGRGAMNWEQIKQSIPTEREVLDDHSISPATADAADQVDPAVLEAAHAADYTAIVDDAVGYDPTLLSPKDTPGAAGTIGGMISDAVNAIDQFIDPKTGLLTEAKDNAAWLAVHRAMFARLGKVMNNKRVGGGKTGLTAAAREEFAMARYLPAMKAVTSWLASRGHFPRLAYGKQSPLYVSIDQIVESLPPDIAGGALFNLNYRLSKFGEGQAARDQFRFGLTIYPTTIGNGVRTAIRGGDAVAILKTMARDTSRNEFQKSKVGQLALADLAAAMSDDTFRAEMKALHEAQQIAAVAVAKQAADEIVAPLAQRIIAAIAKNGDRSETMAAIREAIDAAEQIAPKADGSLVRELVDSKLNNGILATLNDYGTALARADARTARRTGKTPKQQVKAQQDAVEANQKRPRGPNGRFLPREVPTGTSRSAMQARAAAAQDTRAMLDDLEPVAANIEASMIADGAYEATDLGHLMSVAETSQGLGVVGLWEKLAVAAEGSAFMPNLKRLQVAITSGSFMHSHNYVKEMTQWLRGDAHIGGVLGFGGRKVEGLDSRLGQLLNLGRKAADEEVNQQLLVWWQALATHTGVAAARGEQLTDDALRTLLGSGAPMDQRVAGAMGADALGPEQVDMAMELYTHINEVFAPVDGPLARSGLNSADLMREMQRFGFGPQGALGDSLLDPAKSLADQAGIWRNYDAETMAHPLDVLSNWHKALSAASVRPSIGASMSQLFDHTAHGMTAAEAVAAGWKKMPVQADHAGFVAYVDPESYFPPELFRESAYLNRFFEQMEKGLPELIRRVVGPYDATIGTLKSSMTIWNVSHHVTNVLGEYAMLVMAGVNPLHSIRSIGAIKAGGRLLDSDPNIIGTYRANFLETAGSAARPATGTLKDRWGHSDAAVLIRNADGKLTKVNLTPEEIWAHAINDGSAITARESKDMLPGVGREGVEGTRWNKFVNSPANVIGQIDRRLGEFSATRDNLTRLAHYYSTLEKGEYRSLDEAFAAAAADVHSYHPTIQTLSATDQIWTRRIVFFHTWVRQAAARVLITAVEKPAYVTLPSKWQYNQAEANGLEPESLGKPIGPDPRIPSYLSNGVLGPTYLGGYSPWGGVGDLAADEEPHLWGYSLSSPQLDTLKTFFGGVTFDGTPKALTSPFETAAGLLNPLLKAPFEIAANSRVGGIGGPVRDTFPQLADYLLSQTGAPDRISGALGMQPKAGMTPEENAGDTARKQISLLTGLKPTDYTNATAAGVAATERSQRERAALAEAGYTPEQIDLIRKAWKEQRGY